MSVIPVDFGQATLLFTGAALPHGAACVFGYDSSASTSPNADATNIAARVEEHIMPSLADDVTLDAVLTKWGPNATGAVGFASSGIIGSQTGEPSTPNCTYLVRKLTDAGGRINQGRMYLPGVVESKVDMVGTVENTFLTSFRSELLDFLTDIGTDGTPMYLLHNSPSDSPTLVTSFLLEGTIATQRNRMRR